MKTISELKTVVEAQMQQASKEQLMEMIRYMLPEANKFQVVQAIMAYSGQPYGLHSEVKGDEE